MSPNNFSVAKTTTASDAEEAYKPKQGEMTVLNVRFSSISNKWVQQST